jgi:dihydrofolate reductase
MASLIYSVIASLDGYVADRDGRFDWAEPDEEVHTFVNELQRPVGTYLYGRRMYEVMAAWETLDTGDQPAYMRDFAEVWRAAEKVVYSTTLQDVSTPRTRLLRDFSPEAVREMKASAARDMTIAGPGLAVQAFKAGLVDTCHLFVAPVLVGGGIRAFPDGVRLEVRLEDQRRFPGGFIYLRYAAGAGARPSPIERRGTDEDHG